MKLFYFFLLVMLSALNANGQIYFNDVYNIGLNQGATSMVVDTGYVVIGQEITSNYRSFKLMKINLNGDTIWTRNFPKNQFAYYTGSSNSLIKTNDHNYVFGGTLINLQDTTNGGDCLLVKFNNNGDTLWTKNYGGQGTEFANATIQTLDSGYALLGSTTSFGNGQFDFYLVKTDYLGTFEWQQTFGTSGQEKAYSIIRTLDGGFLLSGSQNNQFFIVKTNAQGNLDWQQVYLGTSGPCYVTQLADSTYVLSGAKAISGFLGEAFLIKISKTGGEIWHNHYGSVSGNDWFTTAPLILNDGSIVIGGQQMNGSIPYGMLVKTDCTGNQQWIRTYYANPNIDNYLNDLKSTSDTGLIFCGQAFSTLTDFWVVRIDSNGCEYVGCNVGIEELGVDGGEIEIYPNPTTNEFTIENSQLRINAIHIYNVLGEEVLKLERIANSEKAIDISTWKAGVYFVEVETEKGVVRKKVVKE